LIIKSLPILFPISDFEDGDYTRKTTIDVKKATQLIEAGYEYVCAMDNVKLLRKPK